MTRAGDGDTPGREAAEWLTRLDRRGVSTETLQAFYGWRRDPANAAAFASVEAAWRRAGALGGDSEIDFAVRDLLCATPKPRPFWARRTVLAGGLSLAAAGAAIGLWPRPPQFSTRLGEQRFIILADGSRVHLNTDSRVTVSLSGISRRVELERGEAWFDVEHDTSRPFIVGTGDASVRAVGTSFAVRRYPRGTRVMLETGKVEIRTDAGASAFLMPAQALRTAAGRLGPIEHVDLEAETAWRKGCLAFKDAPLGEAVTEINRYLLHPIVLDAPGMATRKVNGLFEIGDAQDFITAVTALFPLDAVKAGDGSVRLRSPTSSS